MQFRSCISLRLEGLGGVGDRGCAFEVEEVMLSGDSGDVIDYNTVRNGRARNEASIPPHMQSAECS
eukprot:616708-Rhodomonas_salina.3